MTYKVTFNFAGYYGCDESYIVEAENEIEAEELAFEMAKDDLSMMEIEEED